MLSPCFSKCSVRCDFWRVVGVGTDLGVDQSSLQLLVEACVEGGLSPPVVVAPGSRQEVGDALADLIHCDVRLRVGADVVEEARPDGHWHVRDVFQINQTSLLLTCGVVRSVLLKAVLEHVLGPVDLRLD